MLRTESKRGTPLSLEKYRQHIDTELKDIVSARKSALYDMTRYHLGWIDEFGNIQPLSNGKALRPTLCLMACEAVGGDWKKALPAAAAVELLHNFSLIHDDIQDNDLKRRHKPTVWAVWGKAQAINAGNATRVLTSTALSRLKNCGLSAEKRILIQDLLDEASLDLIEGQYMDIEYETRFDITIDDYMKMILGKTASLIAHALQIGAVIGTDDEALIQDFYTFGINLGLGFQITDDFLGIWGNPDITGKPVASDLKQRKKTFPVVQCFEAARDGQREALIKYYTGSRTNKADEIVSVMHTLDAREETQRIADSFYTKSLRILDGLDITFGVKHDFENLIDFLATRTY